MPISPMHSACQVMPESLAKGISFAESSRLGIEAGPMSINALRMDFISSSSAWPSLVMSSGTAAAASAPMRPSRSIACWRFAVGAEAKDAAESFLL